jgi:hypothetical protein
MAAKDKLLERLNTLKSTLELPDLRNDPSFPEKLKCAIFLRKGLGIVTFNILEDYLKERAKEVFSLLSSSNVIFDVLPDELREAATLGALRALEKKAKQEKKLKADWLGLVHDETFKINSTRQVSSYNISNLSLMSENSNVLIDDVSKLLRCLNITEGWNTLQRVSQEIYGGIPSLNQSYENISMRRHSAAHEANFDYEFGWLEIAVDEIRAIAASLDLILSRQCKFITNSPSATISKNNLSGVLKYRFLVQRQMGANNTLAYSERLDANSKSIKNWSDYTSALAGLLPKCQSRKESLIVLNTQRRIIDWHC